MTEQNDQWKDITELCKAATSELNYQEPMVTSPGFSLFDSMSAVEIMDPKMDQCCGLKDEMMNIENVFTSDFELTLSDVTSIVKKLLIYECSFHSGASIMESTHNCIYLWPNSWKHLEGSELLSHKVLLFYCQSLTLSMNYYFNTILTADIYEDEDFHASHQHHLDIVNCNEENLLNPTQLLEELKLVYNDMNHDARVLSNFINLRTKILELFKNYAEWSHKITLKFSKIYRYGINENNKMEISTESFEKIKNDCINFQVLNSNVKDIIQLLLQENENNEGEKEESNKLTEKKEKFIFNPILVKSIQSSAVRHVELFPINQSLEKMKKMLTETNNIFAIFQDKIYEKLLILANSNEIYVENSLSYEDFYEIVLKISEKEYHLLSRSLFVTILYISSPFITKFLSNSMINKGLPISLITSSIVSEQWITGNPRSLVWETLRGLCVCRSRLLTRFSNHVLGYYASTGTEAMFVDEHFKAENQIPDTRQQWMSYFISILTAEVMDLMLCLYVEMDLLANNEWDLMFWYWDFICSNGVFAQDKLNKQKYLMEMSMYEETLKLENEKNTTKSSKNKKKSKKKGNEAESYKSNLLPSPVEYKPNAEDFILKGKGQLCRGFYRTTVLYAQIGLINKNPYSYTTWDTWFNNRFKIFQDIINPPYLSYQDFIKTLRSSTGNAGLTDSEWDFRFPYGVDIDVATLLNGANVCFQNARKFFDDARKIVTESDVDKLENLMKLTKVAVGNSLANMKTGKLLQKILPTIGAAHELKTIFSQTDKCKFKITRNYHPHFPVMEIDEIV